MRQSSDDDDDVSDDVSDYRQCSWARASRYWHCSECFDTCKHDLLRLLAVSLTLDELARLRVLKSEDVLPRFGCPRGHVCRGQANQATQLLEEQRWRRTGD